jgi:hypothetical protein
MGPGGACLPITIPPSLTKGLSQRLGSETANISGRCVPLSSRARLLLFRSPPSCASLPGHADFKREFVLDLDPRSWSTPVARPS